MNLNLDDSHSSARELLGLELVNTSEQGHLSGIIVETESYGSEDEASHSFKGMTSRNSTMFEDKGTIYIYFVYGLHYCFNIVTGPKGIGQAVLIRALQPVEGIEKMKKVMKQKDETLLANGPAKLFRAMCFNKTLNGKKINDPNCPIRLKNGFQPASIVESTRIGINKNIEAKHRFYIKDNPYVSKK